MVSQAGALRGNERIRQLMEEFPEVPPTLVLEADVLREGVKPNDASRLVGRWALPDAHWYFSYDREDVFAPEEATAGYTLSPLAAIFPDGVCWQVMFDSRSPYEVRYEERGRYRLYRDGEPMEEVFFSPRPQWYDRKTSSGKPMASIIAQRGERRLFMAALTYCEYGKDICRYCNINSAEATMKGLGMERSVGKRDQDIFETYVAAAQEDKQVSIGMSGGSVLGEGKEAANYVRIIGVLKRAMKEVGYEVPIGIVCQAMGREDQIKLKEAGASSLKHNIEVWDPRLFEIICPGKAKYVGREKWLEAILRGREIFGYGLCSVVLGMEMAQPYGFKTEDEAAESVLEGWEWMAAHGVSTNGIAWRPAPGTEFAGQPAPRTEYLLRMYLAHYKLSVKHNLRLQDGASTPGVLLYDADFARLGDPERNSAIFIAGERQPAHTTASPECT